MPQPPTYTSQPTSQAIIDHARQHFGFLTANELDILAQDPHYRLTQCLVRCGGCRFVAAVQDVGHLIAIIARDGSDYVRDVALV